MRRAIFGGAFVLAVALMVVSPHAQRGGAGAAAAPVKHPNGTLTPLPLDPGRPWGWATKAFMENPNRKLYNKAKAKLLAGEQVFSHTQSAFNPEQYCQMAPHYDFSWFEMQHSRLRFDQVEAMMHACPGVGAAPMIRMPDALEANMQKAYDLGVLGTIVPTVDDVLEARDAARYARFPPPGEGVRVAASSGTNSSTQGRPIAIQSTTTC